MHSILLRLDEPIWVKIRVASKGNYQSVSGWIRSAIDAKLVAHGPIEIPEDLQALAILKPRAGVAVAPAVKKKPRWVRRERDEGDPDPSDY